MLDPKEVATVCQERFPDAAPEQIAAATEAIVNLDAHSAEWEDVTDRLPELGFNFSIQCSDICYLAEQWQRGIQLRILRKRSAESG